VTPRRAGALVVHALALAVSYASLAHDASAQDFTSPSPPGPVAAPLSMLEWGLAPASPQVALEAAVTRWFAAPDLVTRSMALGGGIGPVRAAAGVAQTGDPELGWSTLGLGLGAAGPEAGAAVRAEARRDRTSDPFPGALGSGVGLEVGGGAWATAGDGLTVWAAAPEAWTRGVAPPLERGLQVGGRWSADDLELWVTHDASARDGGRTAAGAGLRSGPLALWFDARERPLRGSLGLAVSMAGFILAATVESHPVLGETVRLGFRLGSRHPPAEREGTSP
jgi:hypothetical protein